PQEVEAAARADPKVALGWLDARVVAGDAQLATDAIARAARVWHEPGRALVRRLRDECDERHARAGDVAYLLEPDVKEARGGLRDVTVVRALLAIAGARASPAFDRAAATLLLTRVALQRRVRRAEDRLLLELQDDAAGDLGASDADALMARVAACGRVVSAVADDAWHRVRPRSRRHPRRAAGRGRGRPSSRPAGAGGVRAPRGARARAARAVVGRRTRRVRRVAPRGRRGG